MAPFDRNYMDPSVLWTHDHDVSDDEESSDMSNDEESSDMSNDFTVDPFHRNFVDDFGPITLQNNINLAFVIFDDGMGNFPLLGLRETDNYDPYQQWTIEDFE